MTDHPVSGFTVADSWRAAADECEREARVLEGMGASKRESAETYRRLAEEWDAEHADA